MRDPWGNEFCVLDQEFPELLAHRRPWSHSQHPTPRRSTDVNDCRIWLSYHQGAAQARRDRAGPAPGSGLPDASGGGLRLRDSRHPGHRHPGRSRAHQNRGAKVVRPAVRSTLAPRPCRAPQRAGRRRRDGTTRSDQGERGQRSVTTSLNGDGNRDGNPYEHPGPTGHIGITERDDGHRAHLPASTPVSANSKRRNGNSDTARTVKLGEVLVGGDGLPVNNVRATEVARTRSSRIQQIHVDDAIRETA
jgi:hypothetical protein